MTNQTPESVIAEVIEYHADTIGSHYDGCYKHHAVCLAVKLRDMLREPGVPDTATEAERDAALAAIASVTAERDAAMARIAKAWELHEPFTWSFGYGPVQSCKWCADHGAPQEVASWPCPTIAALEGAPEPEALEIPETGLEVRDGDGDLITTGEHRRVLHQGGYVCDTCVNILGINVRWDRADRMEGHPLPAEGERK